MRNTFLVIFYISVTLYHKFPIKASNFRICANFDECSSISGDIPNILGEPRTFLGDNLTDLYGFLVYPKEFLEEYLEESRK